MRCVYMSDRAAQPRLPTPGPGDTLALELRWNLGESSRSGRTLGGDSNVTGEGDGVSSIRGGRLDPIGGESSFHFRPGRCRGAQVQQHVDEIPSIEPERRDF